jgi:hypothetical protein
MAAKSRTIAQMLHDAELAIENTLSSAPVRDAVAPFGYDATHLEIGRTLQHAAGLAVQAQQLAEGAQKSTTARVLSTQKHAWAAYQSLAKLARAIYGKTPGRLGALGLKGQMPRGTAAFLNAANKLFSSAKDQAELATYGYDADRLVTESAKIQAYKQADVEQEAAKGAKQNATRAQDAALKTMNTWVSQYLQVAQVALKDEPVLLEQLGLTVRATKTPAQRSAPKKAAASRAAKKS